MTTQPPFTLTKYKDSNTGVWKASVNVGEIGARRRVSLETKDETEATQLLEEFRAVGAMDVVRQLYLEHDRKEAEPEAPQAIAIGKLCDWFTEKYMPAQQPAPRTLQRYAQVCRDFELWCRGVHIGRINQLNYAKLTEFLDWMSSPAARPGAKGVSPKTADDIKAILRRMFRAAVDAEVIDQAPITKWFIKKHPGVADDTFALTAKQVQEVLAVIAKNAPHVASIVRFMAGTGTRPSDAIDLRWSQVNVEERYARRRQIKTKNLATYSLGDLALSAIKAEEKRDLPSDKGHVFTNTEGHPIAYNALYRSFTRALEAADYTVKVDGEAQTVNLKTLRHTYGTLMANLGMPPFLLQRQMGHTQIETTLKYYHADPAEGLKWALKFDEQFTENAVTTRNAPKKPPKLKKTRAVR